MFPHLESINNIFIIYEKISFLRNFIFVTNYGIDFPTLRDLKYSQ